MIRQIIEKHTHNFNKLSFMHETGIDRFILIRNCSCGKDEAFECGPRDKMRELYKKIKQKENHENQRN